MDGWKTPTDGRTEGWTDANEKGISNTIDAASESNRGRWYRWFAPRVDFFRESRANSSEFIQSERATDEEALVFISRFVGIGGHV